MCKLEVGKWYKTRAGDKVQCIKTGNQSNIVYMSHNHYVFKDTGRGNSVGMEDLPSDVISEWGALPFVVEKGKFYKTRSGRKAECLTTELTAPTWVYKLIFLCDGSVIYTSTDGRFNAYTKDDHSKDIVDEWKEPKKKTGTVYLYETKDGKKGFTDVCKSAIWGDRKILGQKEITITEGEGV